MLANKSRGAVMALRNFTSSSKCLVSNPEEILEEGFKQMQSPQYKKSEKDMRRLVDAGKQLGLAEQEVKTLYSETIVGRSRYSSPEQLAEEVKRESKMLEPPTLDEPYEYNELPPLGHMQLHEHRVQREYVRVAAYDLPRLTKYISPYRPQAGVLKFKYTDYLGEEHNAEKKVVVSFKTKDLGLDQTQLHKLRVLCGTRYNAGLDEVKISCARYPNQAQNKRFLGEVIQDLIRNAKDTADDMSDVPLDTRHVEPKLRRNKSIYPQYKFPEAWKRPQDAPKPSTDFVSQLLG